MKTKKISQMNMPVAFRITRYITYWLLLDRLQVSDVIWGIFWTISVILALISLYVQFISSEYIDIFKNE